MQLADIFDIFDKEEALKWKTKYITYIKDNNIEIDANEEEATKIANSNIGYFAGYSNDRDRIEKLFEVEHPIFGSVAKNGNPTISEAFNLGVKLGKDAKQGRGI
jgi:phage-related minor tail protein